MTDIIDGITETPKDKAKLKEFYQLVAMCCIAIIASVILMVAVILTGFINVKIGLIFLGWMELLIVIKGIDFINKWIDKEMNA
jgi:hypothetical protein